MPRQIFHSECHKVESKDEPLEKPKLVRQSGFYKEREDNLQDKSVSELQEKLIKLPKFDMQVFDNALKEIEKTAEEKDKSNDQIVAKLSAKLKSKSQELLEEKLAFEKELHELAQAKEMLELQKKDLELQMHERALEQEKHIEDIKKEFEQNKKKISALKKKKVQEKKAIKWENLSKGKSSKGK